MLVELPRVVGCRALLLDVQVSGERLAWSRLPVMTVPGHRFPS
jgi:hypothetical protein